MASKSIPDHAAGEARMVLPQVVVWITIVAALLWAAIPPMHG